MKVDLCLGCGEYGPDARTGLNLNCKCGPEARTELNLNCKFGPEARTETESTPELPALPVQVHELIVVWFMEPEGSPITLA